MQPMQINPPYVGPRIWNKKNTNLHVKASKTIHTFKTHLRNIIHVSYMHVCIIVIS